MVRPDEVFSNLGDSVIPPRFRSWGGSMEERGNLLSEMAAEMLCLEMLRLGTNFVISLHCFYPDRVP